MAVVQPEIIYRPIRYCVPYSFIRNTMSSSKQMTLLSMFMPSVSSTSGDGKKTKKKQKTDYEAVRERGVVSTWKTEFAWLRVDEADDIESII